MTQTNTHPLLPVAKSLAPGTPSYRQLLFIINGHATDRGAKRHNRRPGANHGSRRYDRLLLRRLSAGEILNQKSR